MGCGIILGEGSDLNLEWVTATSFANLPSGKPANTLGFITSIAIPNMPRFSNETESGLTQGDIVVKEDIASNAKFNILANGTLFIYPSGAYQYQSGILVPIDSYLYDGSAWKQIYVLFYENNTFPAIVGDFLAYKSSGTSATLIKNALSAQISLSAAQGWAYSQNVVDLTNLSKIWFYGATSHLTTLTAFGVASTYTATSNAAQVGLPVNSQWNWVSLDVSALNGTYYLRFGKFDTTASLSVFCLKMFGVG